MKVAILLTFVGICLAELPKEDGEDQIAQASNASPLFAFGSAPATVRQKKQIFGGGGAFGARQPPPFPTGPASSAANPKGYSTGRPVGTIRPTTFRPSYGTQRPTARPQARPMRPIRPTKPGPATGARPVFSPRPPPGIAVDPLPPVDFGGDHAHNMAQIQTIDVACSKEQMNVRIQFDRPYNGIIYSKGYYSHPRCHYVDFNSNRDYFEFTLSLDSCGTQFIDQFQAGGQAYLENILVFQNEVGIQEVWDTARRIRCLWEGNLEKIVSFNFNVDMIDQQVVTFSGDTANAIMDVQVGRGPFAPSVNGLVKIGETMTIVVSVEGDSDFDIHVQDCVAHDGQQQQTGNSNVVQLTDGLGCVLKPKLMGSFQKTRQGGSGSVIAYAFFQAFKFPDQMEVYLECNVELCKNECDYCPSDNPGGGNRVRGKREVISNITSDISEPVRLARRLRVVSPEDITLSDDGGATITLSSAPGNYDDICLSLPSFITGLVVILIVLIISCVITALLCVKVRAINGTASTYPASSSFHAFSTVSKP